MTASLIGQLAGMLGFGRVPLSITLMVAMLVFGGTGTMLNLALREQLLHSSANAGFSLCGALVALALLSGRICRFLGRVAPAIETYPIKRSDLIGCTAVLISDTDEQGGYAQARDREGNVHNLSCRTCRTAPFSPPAAEDAAGRMLAKGTQVLIVDFEPSSNRYTVEPSPPEPAELIELQQKRPRPRRIATRQ